MSGTTETPNIDAMKLLLQRVQTITERHRKQRRQQGADFNIWEILDRTTAEEKGHSSFLAALLDADGPHGQGRLYLDLFFDVLLKDGKIDDEQAKDYKAAEWQVRVEAPFKLAHKGEKDGRLDILLQARDNNDVIVIENKVYAADQPRQLIRYWKRACELAEVKDKDEDKDNRAGRILLLYLKPIEGPPSGDSLGGEDDPDWESVDRCVERISYKDTIATWVDRCLAASALLPQVRETLCQYQDVIKQITGQSISEEMTMEIATLLTENSGNLRAGFDVVHAIDEVKANIQLRFWRELEKQLKGHNYTLVTESAYRFTEAKTREYYKRGSHTEFGIGILLPYGVEDGAPNSDRFRLSLWVCVTGEIWYSWGIWHREEGKAKPEWVGFNKAWPAGHKWKAMVAAFRKKLGTVDTNGTIAWHRPQLVPRIYFRTFGPECIALADDDKLVERTNGIAEEVMDLIEQAPVECFLDWRNACLDKERAGQDG